MRCLRPQGLYEQWPHIQRQSHVVVHILSLHRTQPMALVQKVRARRVACPPKGFVAEH